MSKKNKVLLVSIAGIIALVLTGLSFFMSIRSDFTKYLNEKYPGQIFRIGFVKIEPIYGNYFANVTCLDDKISFPISKSFNTKEIREDYPQAKSHVQYNSKLRDIFYGSDIKRYIIDLSGGGKIPFQNDGLYSQINLHITEDADLISVARRSISILRENKITAETVGLMYQLMRIRLHYANGLFFGRA